MLLTDREGRGEKPIGSLLAAPASTVTEKHRPGSPVTSPSLALAVASGTVSGLTFQDFPKWVIGNTIPHGGLELPRGQ